MSERRHEIRPYGVDYICDECELGLMKISVEGSMLLTNPPKYKHVCDKCGHEDFLTERYPIVRWENIGVEP